MTRGTGRLVAAAALFATAVAGVAGGIALDRAVLLPRRVALPFDAVPVGPWPPRPFRSPREFEAERARRERDARDRVAVALDLTPVQRAHIDSLFDRQLRAMEAARETMAPVLDSLMLETRRAIDSTLTPAQRERAERMRRERGPPPFLRPGPGFRRESP